MIASFVERYGLHGAYVCRDPITLTIMSVATTVASAGIGAVGAVQQGNAAKAAADYNAKVAQNNAVIARQNADLARSEADAEEQTVRRRTAGQLGTAGAAIGASGLTSEGTPLDVLEETAALGELDALTVRWGGDLKARSFEQQATGYESSAVLERMQGRAAQRNAMFSAAGTLLSGFSSAATGYLRGSSGGGSGGRQGSTLRMGFASPTQRA